MIVSTVSSKGQTTLPKQVRDALHIEPGKQLRRQTGLESFYRLMVTPRTSIIPTLHLIFNPSNNPDKDMIAILGIRARFSL